MMYHDESQLLKVEKWVRWLSWLFAAWVGILVIVGIFNSVAAWLSPKIQGAFAYVPYSPTWYRLWVVFSNARSVIGLVLCLLLLLGLSKTIRFLLALKARVMPEDAAASEI